MCNIHDGAHVLWGCGSIIRNARDILGVRIPRRCDEFNALVVLWELFAESHNLPLFELLHQIENGFFIKQEICIGVRKAFIVVSQEC